jgi:geranylgeranyl reductase
MGTSQVRKNLEARIRNNYDVIIVGANVAGLCCARLLKNTSLRVLVVEKRQVIGEKLCTGILIPSIPEAYYPTDKTFEVSCYFIKQTVKGEFRKISRPMKFVSRTDLANHLLQDLEGSSNITVVAGVPVRQINSKTAMIGERRISFRFLVGADGSNSMVRRYLKLKSKKLLCLVYETTKSNRNTTIQIFNNFRNGYAWITPLLGSTQAGCIFDRSSMKPKAAKALFHSFLSENNFSFGALKMRAMQVSYYFKGIVFGHIFLIGDAAGLANRMDGEGIYEAIVSGEEAARKILDPEYNLEKMKALLKRKRHNARLLFMFKHFSFPLILLRKAKGLFRPKGGSPLAG